MSWLGRLRSGLQQSADRLAAGIAGIFTGRRRLDDGMLQDLEDLLISADLGPGPAARLTAGLAKTRFGREVSELEVREALAGEIAGILERGGGAARARDGRPAACGACRRGQRHGQDDHRREVGEAVSG